MVEKRIRYLRAVVHPKGEKHRRVPQESGLLKNLIFMGLVLMAKEVIIFRHLPTPTVTLLRIRKVSRRKDP